MQDQEFNQVKIDLLLQEAEVKKQLGQWQKNVENRIERVEAAVSVNTHLTAANNVGILEILDLFNSVKGGMKVLGGLGSILKWFVGITAGLAALWSLMHGKFPGL